MDEDHETSGHEDTFRALYERSGRVGVDDTEEVGSIMQEAIECNLSTLKVRMLEERCAKALDVSVAAIKAVAQDLGATHPEHGLLRDTDAVVEAVIRDGAGEGGHVMTVNGVIYTYRVDQGHNPTGIWQAASDEEVDQHLITNYGSHASTRGKRHEIMQKLKARTKCGEQDPFKPTIANLCMTNGHLVLDEDAGEFVLQEHCPEHRARNKVHITFDPAATASEFEAGLLRVVGGCIVKLRAILEFLACAVFGRRPVNDRVRGCMLLIGPPRSGKSTILNLTTTFFLPEQVTSLSPDRWGKAEDVVQLASSALNVVPEIDPHRKISGTHLKKVLSSEPVTGRRMRQNSFSFSPLGFHIWAANQPPRINEQDRSVGRRFLIVPMGEALTDMEALSDFSAVIAREAAGVVNALCRAYIAVQERGHFVLPEDGEVPLARMQFGDDLAGLWTRLEVQQQPGSRLTTVEIKQGLTALADRLGQDQETITDGTLRRVAEILYRDFNATRHKSSGRPYYEGVALKNRPAEPSRAIGDLSDRDASFRREVDLDSL